MTMNPVGGVATGVMFKYWYEYLEKLEKAVLFKLLSMVFERRGLRHYQK